MNNKVAIVGVGGRTGTMFAFEIGKHHDVLGISREGTIEYLKNNDLYIKKGDDKIPFKGKVISDTNFSEEYNPDIIFLTNKNPVGSVLKYYFQKCGDKKPVFVLSQNGMDAINEAQQTLEEIAKPENINVVRMVLFNAIDRRGDTLSYSSPIKVGLAQALGDKGVEKVYSLFKKSGFVVNKFKKKDAKNLEYSKLFLNLIGMASASRGLSIEEGFLKKEVFEEEIKALREYIKIVRLAGGRFLNFKNYPVNLYVSLLSLPLSLLILFRKLLANKITKGRGSKPKDLDEVKYYNGSVVTLAEKINKKKEGEIEETDYVARKERDVSKNLSEQALVNRKIYWRALKMMEEK